jgi:type IV pilus assembly protein PilA
MKSELKAKFLQHLAKKKGDQGFTLIELLVVIIIIGILSAIALPSFLNQANKAKQSEAKTYVGSMNRAQQAYYLEKGEFVSGGAATDFSKLGLGVATTTGNYTYKITNGGTGISTVENIASVNNATGSVKAYLGGVSVSTVKGTNEASTLAVLCEAQLAPVNKGPQAGAAANIVYSATDAPKCDEKDFTAIK